MMTFQHAALLGALILSLSVPVGVRAASAQTPPQPSAKERAAGFGNFGSSKEPIKIDADKLDVFDKEGRAVFSGNVVAVQGESTMNCTLMTVLYEKKDNAQGGAPSAPGGDDSAIKKIDCKGPVTIVSKTQVATGDNASFDRVANRIYLTGNAALSDGPNVTRGERVVYDLNTGVANVETKPGGRVRALFVPGSGGGEGGAAGAGNAKPKSPKPAAR